MSPDLQELEAKLSQLRPAALDSGLLARLADCATGDFTPLTPEAAQLAAALHQCRPAALPPALAAALTAALNPPAPVLVSFPVATPTAARVGHWNRSMLAAAAAVAILGASAALLMPRHDGSPATIAAHLPNAPRPASTSTPPPATGSASDYAPAGYQTGLSQASDEGVIWQNASQPQRVVKVIYRDRLTYVDPSGRKIEVEQPRTEYLLVREKID
jgi:hypothetical protein